MTHFIKDWREHRGLTVAALAEKAGVSGSMISQLETGKTTWTESTLTKLAPALDCQPWQLLASGPVENRQLWETVLSVAVPNALISVMDQGDKNCLTELVQNNCEAAVRSVKWLQLRRTGWLDLDTEKH